MKSKSSKTRPTSRDVAKLAGVSVTTVSYVINNKSGDVRISEETRKKVWEAVKTLNYRPLSAARTLRTKRSNMLALMIPYIETPYHPLLAVAIQREAEKKGFRVLIYDTRHELQREQDFLNVLPSHGVDGVIIHSDQLCGDDIDHLVKMGVAVVVHGNRPTHPFVDNVIIDEVKAAEDAVSYLISKGHSRIGNITPPEATWTGMLRKAGYINALLGHGLAVDDELISEVDYSWQDAGGAGMQKLLALSNPPTAVFSAADRFAVDALLFSLDSGLSVPKDVAIMGFDDTREATRIRPRLTTIHKDTNSLGSAAVQMLVERINNGQSLPSRQKLVPHKLIVRESA